jgi:DNA-binding CsgD family transcriptional regulator
MTGLSDLPWMKINDFILETGNIREPKTFSVRAVQALNALIPYDQARIYYVNDNGKIYDEALFGVDKEWSRIYLEYYSRNKDCGYSISPRLVPSSPLISVRGAGGKIHRWVDEPKSEFILDYIRPLGLRHSTGFCLHDAGNSIKCVCSLDRIRDIEYTERETTLLRIVLAHLDNLHRNMFVFQERPPHCVDERPGLTKREQEIADLIRKGITPANIGRKLYLSLATVYRHIANLHLKLKVSNRQELILKLMDIDKHSALQK